MGAQWHNTYKLKNSSVPEGCRLYQAVSIKERKIIMVHLVPLGLALIVALVTLLVVFFLSEDNEQSKCKVMFLIYLFAIYEIFFS